MSWTYLCISHAELPCVHQSRQSTAPGDTSSPGSQMLRSLPARSQLPQVQLLLHSSSANIAGPQWFPRHQNGNSTTRSSARGTAAVPRTPTKNHHPGAAVGPPRFPGHGPSTSPSGRSRVKSPAPRLRAPPLHGSSNQRAQRRGETPSAGAQLLWCNGYVIILLCDVTRVAVSVSSKSTSFSCPVCSSNPRLFPLPSCKLLHLQSGVLLPPAQLLPTVSPVCPPWHSSYPHPTFLPPQNTARQTPAPKPGVQFP